MGKRTQHLGHVRLRICCTTDTVCSVFATAYIAMYFKKAAWVVSGFYDAGVSVRGFKRQERTKGKAADWGAEGRSCCGVDVTPSAGSFDAYGSCGFRNICIFSTAVLDDTLPFRGSHFETLEVRCSFVFFLSLLVLLVLLVLPVLLILLVFPFPGLSWPFPGFFQASLGLPGFLPPVFRGFLVAPNRWR